MIPIKTRVFIGVYKPTFTSLAPHCMVMIPSSVTSLIRHGITSLATRYAAAASQRPKAVMERGQFGISRQRLGTEAGDGSDR